MDDLPRVFLKSVFNYVFNYDHDSELRQLSGQLSVFVQEKEKHLHHAMLSLYVSPRSSTIHAEFLCCTKDEYDKKSFFLDVGSQLEECLQQVIKAKKSGFFDGVFVHLMADVYLPTHPSLTSFDSRCPRFRKLLQLCTCSREICVDAIQTDTPGGVDIDISWLFDNLLRKDISLTRITVSGRSNNLWNSLLDHLRDRISSEPPKITIKIYEDVPEEHVLRLLKLKTVEMIYFISVDSHHYSSVIQEWEKDVDSVCKSEVH
ncbi:hypothetical protein L596_022666 [Steinernema carpocapsae]|uniref:Uncharacterized protein n=1 Tax=Steinernema carpocapsae TaxID=34508 RepID=A0A4U5MMS9_STECR|nr:hypothetical protein L596_022666 [Steinernema carpocapsae]